MEKSQCATKTVIVDCSHDNSGKKHENQPKVEPRSSPLPLPHPHPSILTLNRTGTYKVAESLAEQVSENLRIFHTRLSIIINF